MGLDISVYRRKSLTLPEREQTAGFDPETGAPLDAAGDEMPSTMVFEARLGDIAAIACARDELARSGVNAPVIAGIIADGTGVGWHIPLGQIPALRAEIAALRALLADESLARVIERLDEAAQFAASEGTPIAIA